MSETLIDRLFMRFSAIYGHKWNSVYPTLEAIEIAKREWQQLINRLTIEQIKQGVEYCKEHHPWPPSMAEFVNACKEDESIPTAYQAFQEATHANSDIHPWSHPVVYHTAKQVGFYALRTKSERDSRPLFESVYAVICRRFKNGQKLEVPVPKALPETIHQKAKPEHAATYLTRIREMLERNKEKANAHIIT